MSGQAISTHWGKMFLLIEAAIKINMIRKSVNLEGLSRPGSLTAADAVDASLTQQLEALEHFSFCSSL